MPGPNVKISLKRFLLIQECPESWKGLNLYLFRDKDIVFYVGQSRLAFSRVWEHLLGGFRGHSTIGRFVWVNWPKSMRFTIELLTAQSEVFRVVEHDLSAAERLLIQRWSPCFNISLNREPTPLPDSYLPANAPFRRRRGFKTILREAERAVKIEDTKLWVENVKW